MEALKDVSYDPVFLMGFHRSGTTLLYQLLNGTSAFSSLTCYHILTYDELLANFIEGTQEEAKRRLDQLLVAKQVADRKIDGLRVHADFTEEYCFLLENQTGERQLNEKSFHLFDEMCRKLRYASNTRKPLLLKNPWDFPNFLYIKNALPNARFVFIHRHPFSVINSQLHAIRSLLEDKNEYTAMLSRRYERAWRNPLKIFAGRHVYSSRLPLLIRRVSAWAIRGAQYYLENIGALSKKDYLSIRYEDLCENRDGQMHSMLSFLEVRLEGDIHSGREIQPRTLSMSPDLARWKHRIYSSMASYFEQMGYNKDT